MEAFNIPINVSCIMYHNIRWICTEIIIDLIRLQFDVQLESLFVFIFGLFNVEDCKKKTEYMQTFLFEILSSFSNKRGCLLMFAKHFSNTCCCMTNQAWKISSVFLIPICALLLFCFAVQLPQRGISSCIYLKAVEQ